MDYSLPGSSVHGISQARILVWVAISFSSNLLYYAEDPCYLFYIQWGFPGGSVVKNLPAMQETRV